MKRFLFTIILAFPLGAQAQYIPGSSIAGVELNLPLIQQWVDDQHYIKTEIEDRKRITYKVDATTGEAEPYSPPALPSKFNTLRIIDGDIVFNKKQLTQTSEKEATPLLSPDGKWIAFTRENDLYAYELASGREIRYTTDGSEVIKNGYASWMYNEEILGRDMDYRAYWWSPDGKYLAFFRTDESMVPAFPIYNASGTHGYTEYYRYPKAGDPNPEVSIGIVPVEGGDIVWADFNPKVDQYFGTPFWRPDGSGLFVQWMCREQNNLKLFEVNPQTGEKVERYNEQQSTWIDWIKDLTWLRDGSFLIIRDFDGWEQIYLHQADGSLKKQLTHGRNWNTKVIRVDEEKGVVYYTSCGEISTRTDFYSVHFNGKGQKRLSFGDYTHKRISLSPDNSWFITYYENVSTPTCIAIVNVKTGEWRKIADSKGPDFDKRRNEFSHREMLWLKTADGFDLPACITWPKNMQKGKRYPLIVHIYGGPNAGTVAERWTPLRFMDEEECIRVSLDHRGSGHCGKRGMNCMHRNLGKWEMEDYIAWIKQLRTYPQIDSTRIMITGASYGGYITSLALTYGAGYFQYGYAKSGVTDWRLYDSHYTERYMDKPQDNPEGYKAASVLTYADRYQTQGEAMLHIEHGMMDDNVHVQQSIQLIDTLQHLNKKFEMMFYPNERHSWIGVKMKFTGGEMSHFIKKWLLQN